MAAESLNPFILIGAAAFFIIAIVLCLITSNDTSKVKKTDDDSDANQTRISITDICFKKINKPNPDSRYKVVFVLGGPGSGKGTNCSRIVENFGFEHLSAGDLLRAERATGSELADMINTYIKEGKIVPAQITVRLLREAMEKSGSNKFLVDGFPRDMENLLCWEDQMASKADVPFLLFLDCPEEVMCERLLERGKTSGRNDDNLESIRQATCAMWEQNSTVKRFRTYEESTRPIIEHFRELGKCREVDSSRDQESVFADVASHFRQ